MNTVIYLIRHSKTENVNHRVNHESLLLQNEKTILSIEGEKIAYHHSKNLEFQDLDFVISSAYVRAMATAKYFLNSKTGDVCIMDVFGERKHGVSSYSELPSGFEMQQFKDEDYKIGFGESQKEVRERMYSGLMKVLDEKRGQKVAIISHSTAVLYLLMKWCKVDFDSSIRFQDDVIMEGEWHYCETFKLVFDENKNLIQISNISV